MSSLVFRVFSSIYIYVLAKYCLINPRLVGPDFIDEKGRGGFSRTLTGITLVMKGSFGF